MHEKRTIETVFFLLICLVFLASIFSMGCTDDKDDSGKRNENAIELGASPEDGMNKDETMGCFFTLRLVFCGPSEAADPHEYSYWVGVKDEEDSFVELNSDFRSYDSAGNPVGGDRNSSFRYDGKAPGEDTGPEADTELWEKGEYIAFDMPKAGSGLDILDGNLYTVMITFKDMKEAKLNLVDFVYRNNGY